MTLDWDDVAESTAFRVAIRQAEEAAERFNLLDASQVLGLVLTVAVPGIPGLRVNYNGGHPGLDYQNVLTKPLPGIDPMI